MFTFGNKLLESSASQRSADLQSLGDDRRSDQLVAGHFLHELVVGGLVEQDQVVQFITCLSLRPFLHKEITFQNIFINTSNFTSKMVDCF